MYRMPRGTPVFIDPDAAERRRIMRESRHVPDERGFSHSGYVNLRPGWFVWETGWIIRYQGAPRGCAIVGLPGMCGGIVVPISCLREVRDPACRIPDSPSPGAYVAAMRRGFRETAAGHEVCIHYGFFLDAAAFAREFHAALDGRINKRAAYRPLEPREGEIGLWRDSRRVRDILTTRLRVQQFETHAARSRFGHLLASRDD